MEVNSYKTSNDIYLIEIEDKYIIYAPLKGVATLCDAESIIRLTSNQNFGENLNSNSFIATKVSEINGLTNEPIADNPDINLMDRLVIIPSHKCNLSCSYCYAQESRSTKELDLLSIKRSIEYIFCNNTGKTKVFTFIGGGEPFMTWRILADSIDYIIQKSSQLHIKYQIRIVTNATLLTRNIVKWLSEKKDIIVNVSSDILPDIQNSQRRLSEKLNSFDLLTNAINLLREFHIPYTLRSTITLENVHRMREMVEFASEHYPDIKRLHFEPVTDNSIDNRHFFDLYLSYFFEALTLSKRKGIVLTNSYISSINHIKRHFCQGELCIVPGNRIVACHRHSSTSDEYFDSLEYGYINPDGVNINPSKLKKVQDNRNNQTPYCDNCFAKFHCAGGCTSKRLSYGVENNLIHCDFIRKIIGIYILLKTQK